jgi:hypothetical protein
MKRRVNKFILIKRAPVAEKELRIIIESSL